MALDAVEGCQLGCGFQPLYATKNTEHGSKRKNIKTEHNTHAPRISEPFDLDIHKT